MKKICFITSTRADYGLLKWSMKEVQSSADLQLQVIATGMHLSPVFGETYKEIEIDQIQVDEKVSLGSLDDSVNSVNLQLSEAVKNISQALIRLQPDAVVLLGDRYEILGAAQAAFFLSIPIIHLHGGEKTEGAFDDVIRHCITKLSQYHITSTEVYRQRVIQLGEAPERVFNLGAPGLENFLKQNLMSKEELAKSLGATFLSKNVLVTFHPVTGASEDISNLLRALEKFPNVGQFISLPNSDPGYSKIATSLKDYAAKNPNVFLFTNLGPLKYSSMLKIADLVVGNSSSGILESPFVGTKTLNIGERQKGRLYDDEIVTHVECREKEIYEALNTLLKEPYTKQNSLLYGTGNFAKPFIKLISQLKFTNQKKFHDLERVNA
nr:UDP-N-acetylglucosamine 2-epimerase [Bacteriovorax sp. HI3]